MQALIVVVLMVLMSMFTYMENNRNNINSTKLITFKAANVAANIMQYADMLTQYVLTNYDTLHDNDYTDYSSLGHVRVINDKQNEISIYSQKNLKQFLNFTASTFDYGVSHNDNGKNLYVAKLYLVISFSNYVNSAMYKNISLDNVMGELADKYGAHLYQGQSVTWELPLLVKQDGACNAIVIFGQIPNDSNGLKQMNKISELFKYFCTTLVTSGYIMQKYVYIAEVVPTTI